MCLLTAIIAFRSVSSLITVNTWLQDGLIDWECFDHEKSIAQDKVVLVLFWLEFDHLDQNGLGIDVLLSESLDSIIGKLSYGLSHFGGKLFLTIISANLFLFLSYYINV